MACTKAMRPHYHHKRFNVTPYQEYWHRHHVNHLKNIKKYVDASPPDLYIRCGFDFWDEKMDSFQLQQQTNDNIALLVKMVERHINKADRNNSYMNEPDKQGFFTRIPQMQRSLQEIQRQNKILAKRLMNTRSVVSARSMPAKMCNYDSSFTLPTEIMAKYKGEVPLPLRCAEQRKLFRPLIFIDLEVVGVRPAGRIIIQLYTEACPEVVLALVRACKRHDVSKLRFVRLFPELWLQGFLVLDNKQLSKPKVEYDKRALSVNSAAYILSFPANHLKGVRDGIFTFTISFKPLNLSSNDSRVAFGVVQQGRKNLQILQDNGTKNGKLKKPIGIVAMGIIQ